MISIHRQGDLLVAGACSYEQSRWLGDQGFWFYGRNARRAMPLPVNTRYLPVSKAAQVAHLAGHPDLQWAPEALEVVQPAAQAHAASWAQDAEIMIPAPAGLQYRGYQRAGIAAALAAFQQGRRGILIGDEMGLGKTMQAIGTMAVLAPQRTLVACPASLRLNWLREIEKWLPVLRGAVHVVGEPRQPDFDSARVVICNYDKVVGSSGRAKATREALGGDWDLVVLDEAHVLKNPAAQRTQAFLGKHSRDELVSSGIAQRTKHLLCLTGTPIQNRVRESITLLRAIGAIGPGGAWPSEGRFLFRHCGAEQKRVPGPRGGRTVWTFDGSDHLDELQSTLRGSGAMVRRLKAEVATELPPKLRSVITLPCEGCDERSWDDDDGDEELDYELDALTAADFSAGVAQLIGRKVGFDRISATRAQIAARKAEAVVAHVEGLLDQVPKVLVFGHHQALLDELERAFPASIRIDGATPPSGRQALVDRFQADPSCRVAILSTHAAGVGLTLTAASTVVFAEADWNPSWCVQAEDRAHRIGQTAEQVTIQYLVLDRSLDARVVQTMIAKLDVADRALDRRKVTGEAPADAPARKADTDGKVTIVARGEAIEVDMPAERIAAVAEGLLTLAGQCDGARKEDGHGFDKLDAGSPFVQKLVAAAGAGSLTPKQAAWGLRTLRRYHRTQLTHMADRLWPTNEENAQ